MTNPLFDLTGQVAFVTGPAAASASTSRAPSPAPAPTSSSPAAASDDLCRFRSRDRGPRPPRHSARISMSATSKASQRMADAAEAACGRIHILVNNAGCNVRKPALDVTWDDWNLILDTNLRGSFFVAQQIARRMVPHGYGRIINIGSVTSVFGYAGLAPYGASRGGIRQLTMSLADDWGKHGITVNCLAPGWFHTAQNKVLYENKEWVDYLVDRIPLKRPGAAPRPRRRRRLSRLRGEPLHHRPDPARRRRHLHRIHPRHGRPNSTHR